MTRIRHGVAPYSGLLSGWFGWAQVANRADSYEEGSPHFFKLFAVISSWRLAAKLQRKFG